MNEEKEPLENQELPDDLMEDAATGGTAFLNLVPLPALNLESAILDFEINLEAEKRRN